MKGLVALACALAFTAMGAAADVPEADATSAAKLEQVRAIAAERAAVRSEGDSEQNVGGWSSAQEVSLGGTAFKMFTALGLTIGVLLIGVHFYRRYSGAPTVVRARRIRIVERVSISAKTALVLVEFDGRPMILSVGADNVTAVEPQVSEIGDVERLCRDEAALVAVGS